MKKLISQDLMNALLSYQWPGNIRELENLVERLVISSDKDIITIDNLPEDINLDIQADAPSEEKSLKQRLEEVEGKIFRDLCEKGLSSYKIASILKISQSQAYGKIKKYTHLSKDSPPAETLRGRRHSP